MKLKRKWITRKQISEVIYEGCRLTRNRKSAGLPKNYITYDSYGFPVGQYVAACAYREGLTTDEAVASLKKHKKKPTVSLSRYPNADVFNRKKK